MGKQHGFTLLETAIVLVIVALIAGAGLSLAAALRTNQNVSTARTKQEAIKEALITFIARNQRLPCPLGQLDAKRLREAAHDVEDEREALGLTAGRPLFVFLLRVGGLFVLTFVADPLRHLAVRALERPEEKCREPRVLLDCARGAVPRLGLGRPETTRGVDVRG